MTITFTVPDEILKESFDEFLSPVMKDRPRWLSLLPSRRSIRSCPAFTWLFKDSIIVRLPCDLMMIKDGENFRIDSMNPKVMNVYSHDLTAQLSEEHSKDFINVKISPLISFQASKPVKAVQMTAFNYTVEHESLFRSVEGVFPFIKEATQLNINTFFRTSELIKMSQGLREEESVLLPAGTPLCLLYFPSGIPKYKVKVGDITKSDVFYRYRSFKSGIARIYYEAFKNDK